VAHVPFQTVDVFTLEPFLGNPVAVVLDASGLSGAQMQRIANWTNLSETTFVVPVTADGADYHVRIFTPASEMPFAGHPTIGTAHALLEAGLAAPRDGVLVQQCQAGLVRIAVTQAPDGARWIAFDLPTPKLTACNPEQAADVEAILGTPLAAPAPCLVDVGPRWLVAQLPTADAVLACRPDLARMKARDSETGDAGIVIFGAHAEGATARIEVRAFAPAHGVDEDPVCGSGNGAVAAYIRHTGQAAAFGSAFLATQGRVVGRAGVLRLSISDDAIRVGGNAVTRVEGRLRV
jgi:PhzF family phenazine biosynthesis protein